MWACFVAVAACAPVPQTAAPQVPSTSGDVPEFKDATLPATPHYDGNLPQASRGQWFVILADPNVPNEYVLYLADPVKGKITWGARATAAELPAITGKLMRGPDGTLGGPNPPPGGTCQRCDGNQARSVLRAAWHASHELEQAWRPEPATGPSGQPVGSPLP
jgi:hypothetical protein